MKHILIGLMSLITMSATAQEISIGIRSGRSTNLGIRESFGRGLNANIKGWQNDFVFRAALGKRLLMEGGLSYNKPNIKPILLDRLDREEFIKARMQIISAPVSLQLRIGPNRKLRFYTGILAAPAWEFTKETRQSSRDGMITDRNAAFQISAGLIQNITYRITGQLEAQCTFAATAQLSPLFGYQGSPTLHEMPYLTGSTQLGLAYVFQ
jgi:hypothetical protein